MLIIETWTFGESDNEVPLQSFIKDKLFENSRIVKLEYNDTPFYPDDGTFNVSGMKLQFTFDNWIPSEGDFVTVTLYKQF